MFDVCSSSLFPKEILKLILFYLPEGPFLWYGTKKEALDEYQKGSTEELVRLLGKEICWLLADLVPHSKLFQVSQEMKKRMIVCDNLLTVSEKGEGCCDCQVGRFCFMDCENLVKCEDVLKDPDLRLLYFDFIKNNRYACPDDSDYLYKLQAIELDKADISEDPMEYLPTAVDWENVE